MGALAVGAMATRRRAVAGGDVDRRRASDALGMRPEEAFSGERAPTLAFTVDASCPSAKVRRKNGGVLERTADDHGGEGGVSQLSRRGFLLERIEGWRCRRWLGTREGSP